MGEDIAPVLKYTYENLQEGDIIYVYYASSAPFKYYLSRYRFPENTYIFGEKSREDWSAYIPQLIELADSHHRVWLVFSHVYSNNHLSEESFILENVESIGGSKIDSQYTTNASVYLYEFIK